MICIQIDHVRRCIISSQSGKCLLDAVVIFDQAMTEPVSKNLMDLFDFFYFFRIRISDGYDSDKAGIIKYRKCKNRTDGFFFQFHINTLQLLWKMFYISDIFV